MRNCLRGRALAADVDLFLAQHCAGPPPETVMIAQLSPRIAIRGLVMYEENLLIPVDV